MASNQAQKPPKPVFVATTIVIFFLSLSAAESVGFVPCYVDGTECTAEAVSPAVFARGGGPETVALSSLPELGPAPANSFQLTADSSQSVLPEQIVIPEIDLDLPVQNPETRDIATLDEYLKDGPVRYVDSARLGEKGNVLIFAHTSHLPIVKNRMYKAFNRVPELKAGDSITLEGDGHTYLYTVTSLTKVDVAEGIVDLSPTLGKKLTLVTCDTLTGKSARFILEADFVAVI
ncbi:sortase [Candidatus Kaiserbacteria bacterium]|nr:sortase [Candidatus Kaiserbacteria bacterium]